MKLEAVFYTYILSSDMHFRNAAMEESSRAGSQCRHFYGQYRVRFISIEAFGNRREIFGESLVIGKLMLNKSHYIPNILVYYQY